MMEWLIKYLQKKGKMEEKIANHDSRLKEAEIILQDLRKRISIQEQYLKDKKDAAE